MNYIEINIPVRDLTESEIMMAALADLPFESFEQGDTFLKAYIPEGEFELCRGEVDEIIRATGVAYTVCEIEQQNWNEVWESNFEPVDVDGRVVIRAPFHDEPAAAEVDVVIMPKMSFGTGHHATTWLMTAAVMDMDVSGLRGLDMGSGTGVLAIVAARRGAVHVDAVDIDEWAWENCRENVAANNVGDVVVPIQGDVSAIEGRVYDFILANINRNILLADMGAYVRALYPDGVLVMSGILESDIPAISDKAQSLGLTVAATRTRDGWAAIVCRR